MDASVLFESVLLLIAGIGIFIIACKMLSTNIEYISSKQMKKMFAKASKRKLAGIGIGTATTAVIQSSAATIVLVFGFLNAGMMTLGLAASIIYGANIGTTITVWIASLSTLGAGTISVTAILAAFTGIGALWTLFAKKDSTKAKAGLVTSFGLIFVALFVMSVAMGSLAEAPEIRDFIAGIDNIFLLILIGFLITGITQSSSVTTAILISMLPIAGAATGLIDLQQAIYVTLGANIGSCIIVIISAFTSTAITKKASLIHLFFNIFGVAIFIIADFVFNAFGTSMADLFGHIFVGYEGLNLAIFHTTFNAVTTALMLPLTPLLLKFVDKVIPENAHSEDGPHLFYMNKYMLRNPPVAVQQLKSEVVNMSSIAMTNFKFAYNMIKNMNFSQLDEFKKNEVELDYLNKEIADYLVRFSKLPLTRRDRFYVSSVYHTITDLERVGDYSENIVEYAQKLNKLDDKFSGIAIEEIKTLEKHVLELYDKIVDAYINVDLNKFEEAFSIEEKIDDLTDKMADNHIERLNSGICNLDVGAEYLSLTSDTERIADHIINMGRAIKEFGY